MWYRIPPVTKQIGIKTIAFFMVHSSLHNKSNSQRVFSVGTEILYHILIYISIIKMREKVRKAPDLDFPNRALENYLSVALFIRLLASALDLVLALSLASASALALLAIASSLRAFLARFALDHLAR